VLDGDKDSVEENQNDDEPVECLTLDKTTDFDSAPETDAYVKLLLYYRKNS